ncbi:MAG: hypothetical protein ACEPOW_08255 [Bacteroidales bacterium]
MREIKLFALFMLICCLGISTCKKDNSTPTTTEQAADDNNQDDNEADKDDDDKDKDDDDKDKDDDDKDKDDDDKDKDDDDDDDKDKDDDDDDKPIDINTTASGNISWNNLSSNFTNAYYVYENKTIHIFLYSGDLKVVKKKDNNREYEFIGTKGCGVYLKTIKHSSTEILPATYNANLELGKTCFSSFIISFFDKGNRTRAISRIGKLKIAKQGKKFKFTGINLKAMNAKTPNRNLVLNAEGFVPKKN